MAIRSLIALIVVLAARPIEGPTLVVSVVEDISRRSLANAEVIDLDTGVRWFTNAAGEARLPWPASARLRLRVRQLGFQPVERTVERTAIDEAADTLTIALTRIAYALPEVVTREARRCENEADSLAKARSLPALEQLRLGAERYEAFRKAYPFRIQQERRTILLEADGKKRLDRRNNEQANSDQWGVRYDPNETVIHRPLGFSVPILFVATLADSMFWARHCFAAPGIQLLDSVRVVRLEFAPASGVRGPEWQGVAFLDSATSLLRRVEFSLAGLPENDQPRRFEGYTTFSAPSPYIAIPDSTVAMWWRDGPRVAPAWGFPDVLQLVHVTQLRYRKGTPP